MKPINIFTLSICFTLALYAGNSLAASCSKSDVDHYLKSGFNHAQVVKLCENSGVPAPANNTYRPPANTGIVAAAPVAAPTQDVNQVYFEAALNADNVAFSGDNLAFERKECVIYGELDMTQTREKACAKTRAIIGLKGLDIVRAQKGIVLIRKQELVVKGNISREFIDFGNNNKYKVAALRKGLAIQPSELEIPLTKGIDPNQVVKKLRLYR